jgi:hypothetical protein
MLEKLGPSAEEAVDQWVRAFGLALTSGDYKVLAKLFLPDSLWRNLFGMSWQLATLSGNEILCHELSRRAGEVRATDFRVNTTALAPRRAIIAGREVIEAIICFDTINGPGIGAVRLVCPAHAPPAAWTISTSLDFNKICNARSSNNAPVSHARDFATQDWFDGRQAEIAFDDREPDVLVVGGGHAGISAAVELKRIGLDALASTRPGESVTIGGCATAASSFTTRRRSITSVTCRFRRPFRTTSRRTKSRIGSRATSTSWRSISGPQRHSTAPNTMRQSSDGQHMSNEPTAPPAPFGPGTSCSPPASAAPPTFPKFRR